MTVEEIGVYVISPRLLLRNFFGIDFNWKICKKPSGFYFLNLYFLNPIFERIFMLLQVYKNFNKLNTQNANYLKYYYIWFLIYLWNQWVKIDNVMPIKRIIPHWSINVLNYKC